MKLIPTLAVALSASTPLVALPIISNSPNITTCQISFISGSDYVLTGTTVINIKSGKTFATITPPQATKQNYSFVAWQDVISGTIITPSTVINNNLNLVPVFNQNPILTFSTSAYDQNFNPIQTPTTLDFNEFIFTPGQAFYQMPQPLAEIENYSFLYWLQKNDQGNLIKVSQTKTFLSNVTLYPCFKPVSHLYKHKITMYYSGSTLNEPNVKIEYYINLNLLSSTKSNVYTKSELISRGFSSAHDDVSGHIYAERQISNITNISQTAGSSTISISYEWSEQIYTRTINLNNTTFTANVEQIF